MEQALAFLGGILSVLIVINTIKVFKSDSKVKELQRTFKDLQSQDLQSLFYKTVEELNSVNYSLEDLKERMDDCEDEDHDLNLEERIEDLEERIDDLEERMDDCEDDDTDNLLDISETIKSFKKLIKSKLN